MSGCAELTRKQFQARKFLLSHDNPKIFVQFQCGCPRFYIGWRVFWALYHIGWIIASGIRADFWAKDDRSQYIKWFIFVTNWAYFTLTLTTIVDAVVVGYVYGRRRDIVRGEVTALPWYLKANWCLYTLGNTVSLVVSVTFFAIIYDGSYPINAISAETHITNSVYVILNILVTGTPSRLLHFWISVPFGLFYTLFSLFYYLADGTNHNGNPYVYPALNWNNPGKAIMYSAILTFVVTPLFHFVLFAIYCLRILIAQKCSCFNSNTKKQETYELKNTAN